MQTYRVPLIRRLSPVTWCGGLAALAFVAGMARAQSGGASASATSPAVVQKLETGVSYSRGDYGLATDTEVLVVPFNYVNETGPWKFRATLPWLHLTGPAAVVADGGGTAGGPVRPNGSSTSGLGDSMLTATYALAAPPAGWRTDLSAKVKLPTGDEDRGLGTGEFDYYGQVDFYRTYASFTPFFNGGYRVLGDGIYQLKDGFYASGGVVVPIADASSIGGALNWREAIVAGGDDATEASAFYHTQLSSNWSTTVYAMKGFTDASADYGAGASFSFKF
ncbi:hypothetical protein [Synoicihabitans lomoniglobus]|uniref:Transporter n=1 Tax=Synoicihabitans lomoniglobus TaxID=2909285 RepID=A0AAF0CS95_9BACT|nr:hypothetical protein [Opitutaceae bacterium LMO-M01]WED67106.1 hypothetical protein PXH66_09605 [Opitutaceae bacterium LMO-M01]